MSDAAAPADLIVEASEENFFARLQTAWSLDLRSLALFRVALAFMVLVDLVARSTELRAFYTDFGILPRSAWHALRPAGFWSAHVLFGSTWMQVVLFLMAAIFAGMMLVGWHTRMATVVSWLMLVSLQNRMPAIESHDDILLGLLVFYAMFLPLGSRWSIDGARQGFVHEGTDNEFSVFTPASFALMLQIAFVFAFGYLWKSSPEWKSGRALFYALNMEPWATTSGRGMLHFPGALTFITRYILLVDLFTPLLIFVPWKYGRVRTYTIIVAIMLQVLLAMMLRLGLFPFMVMTALLALLPAWYWETQERSAHFSDHLEWELTERFSRREGGLKLPSFLGYVASAISILAMLLVLVWNVAELRGSQPNARLQRVAHLLRLDQEWDLLT